MTVREKRADVGPLGSCQSSSCSGDCRRSRHHLLKRQEVEAATTLSRSSIYRLIANGQFPRPIKVSSNRRAWLSADVDAWLELRKPGSQ